MLIFAALISATSPAEAADDFIVFAQSLSAQQYDRNLPSIPVQEWLTSSLPRGVQAAWGETVTDCGEQTGDPETDSVRDMPLCAEITLMEKGEMVGTLLLFVGTEKTGRRKDAGLYYGYFREGGITVPVNALGEIRKMKGRM